MRHAGLVLLLLVVPLVAADPPAPTTPFVIANPTAPTTTALYFHLLGSAASGAPFLINTQQPPPSSFRLTSSGLGGGTSTCLPTTGVAEGQLRRTDTVVGSSLAGLVDYDDDTGGSPRIADPAPDLAADVRLDPGEPVALDWFVVPRLAGGSAPVPATRVVVQATLRGGEERSPAGDFTGGTLLAQGTSAPATLARAFTSGATYESVGGNDVYGFSLKMPVAKANATLPARGGFSLRVDLFMDVPACPDPQTGALMPGGFEPFLDARHMPSLRVVDTNPVLIEAATMETFSEGHVFAVSASSPWGNYDVDATGIRLDVTGLPAAAVAQTKLVWRTHEYHHTMDPVEGVWVWDHRASPPQPGTYSATFTVPNRAHTANATAHLTFTVGARATPTTGLGAGFLLVLVAAAALRRPLR